MVLAAAAKHSAQEVRDLFSGFLPPDPAGPRLGSAPRPTAILALKGDAGRGKDLYWKSAGLQCANCHRLEGKGNVIGPDLSRIGGQRTRPEILESLLEPSKRIEPAYVAYIVQAADGKVVTGLLVKKDASGVVLKTATNTEARFAAGEVEKMRALPQSLMPDGLMRDLTAQQAADLVAYLCSLR
jgi:putative heme-binding domain-containing protein